MSSDTSFAIASIVAQFSEASESARRGFDEHVEKVFLVSTENFCPVDRGKLKGSARNEIVTDTPTERTRRISYGNGEADYAFWVHERLDLTHTNPPTACAKYLERAVSETQVELIADIELGL